MRRYSVITFIAVSIAQTSAYAQEASQLRDLDPLSPQLVTKQELDALMPNAKMSRTIANGNLHLWKNGTDGTFIVSSDNRATNRVPATGQGKWHIANDGRYCILIQWRTSSEEWCRFILKTTDGYYATKSLQLGTEKVYKLDIKQ